jgi:hypothetical protein
MVMHILIAIVVLIGLWLGCAFVQGFIEGFVGEMRRNRWRELRGVWRQCEKENPRRDL